MTLTSLADRIAEEAHRGQTYWSVPPQPYIEHPRRVAARFAAAGARLSRDDLETGCAAALLHDVVEDAGDAHPDLFSLDALRAVYGVPERVLEIVALLTHSRSDTLEAYWARIAQNPLACRVKTADIADNRAPERVAHLSPDDASRFADKYARALTIIDPDGALTHTYGVGTQ